MKAKDTESKELVKISKSSLLSLVVSKLKGRIFFPEKNEEAKEYLQKVTVVSS